MTRKHYIKKYLQTSPMKKAVSEDKRLELVNLLMGIKEYEVAELADIFGVTRQTVRNRFNRSQNKKA